MLRSSMHFSILIVSLFCAASLCAYEHGDTVPADFKMPQPLSLADSLKTLATKPELEIELVAAEPLTMDPIAIDFGPDGKLWIVEMADYPLGLDGKNKPGGRVRFLTDSNGDGKFDQSTLFLEGLNFPTGVKAWKNGIIVVAAPDIFYAEDTNNDGIADEREVLFRGFKEGNQQHRVNGLVWGLDNYLHLANGDSGGTIESVKTGETLELGAFDLKINPDLGVMVKTSGRTQYGRVRDDYGNWFGCSNSKPIFQFVLRQELLTLNPHVVYPPAAVSITAPAWAPRIFPTSKLALRYNVPDARSRITSACGLSIYRDDALGNEFYNNAFVCEPVHNLVHRRVLKRPDGELIFKGERAEDEQDSEFFTSTDPWCRPVFSTTGPDGAIWIVDMHRYVIEHPEWIPEPWQKVLDLRAGHELGRIYRIKNANCSPPAHDSILDKSDAELVAMLASKNGRVRDMAHQLLYERASDLPTRNRIPEQSAALIEQSLDLESDKFPSKTGSLIETRLLSRLHATSVSSIGSGRVSIRSHTDHRNGSGKYADAIHLAFLYDEIGGVIKTSSLEPRSEYFVAGLFESFIGNNELSKITALLAPEFTTTISLQKRYAILLSVLDRRKISLADFSEKLPDEAKLRLEVCAKFSVTARKTVVDSNADLKLRLGAINLLGRADSTRKEDVSILTTLAKNNSTNLAKAAVKRLGELREFGFLESANQVAPEVLRAMLESAIGQSAGAESLLDLAESEAIPLGLFDASSRSRLTSYGNGGIRKRANLLFDSASNENRAAVLKKFETALKLNGDAKAGKVHFQTACAACHQLDGIGVSELGADLTALTDKSGGALLTAILDPNRAIEDKFLLYLITLKDGSNAAGMIQGESGDTISLKALDSSTKEISRSQISKMENTGRSAMPEGLEATLDPHKMADLIAFIQQATK